ncbi:unnamed protein product [Adineta steineri]|uniref:Uncharacterized protein n=1 Tax=Adineta steineri TaxID=433720 RepID=A0A815NP81_9BILA|nr:unnamed protein product [Adineta steineri]CAF4145319.1 unnamed protein product [Adineta steineri]
MLTTISFRVQQQQQHASKSKIGTSNFPQHFGLKLLRDIMNENAFLSSYFLNWYWWRDINDVSLIIPIITKDGCSCGTQSDCIDSGGIYYSLEYIKVSEVFAMSGWHIGCSVVETLWQSTFECLYSTIYSN